jgi:PucR-like helix-turn-helix protein
MVRIGFLLGSCQTYADLAMSAEQWSGAPSAPPGVVIDHDSPPSRARDGLAAIVRRIDPADVAERMVALFRDAIPGYHRLPGAVLHGEIAEISRRNVELFFDAVLEGRTPTAEDLAPFQRSARDRATEGVPLEDLLQAYRLGGRIGWQSMERAALPQEREALLVGAELLMDYVDRVSSAVSQAYLEESRHLVSEEERRVRAVLDALVDFSTPVAELRRHAEHAGFALRDDYRPFAAAVRGAPAHRHSELAAALRVQGLLALTEGDRVTGVLAGDDAPLRHVAGEHVVVAIAEPVGREQLTAVLDDMRLLADLGRQLGRGGLIAADTLLPELLLAGSPRAAATLHQRVLGPLEAYRPPRGEELVETLAVHLECRLDRRATAGRLHLHPNTLDHRLRRVRELTGLDTHDPEHLLLIALALRQRALANGRG